MKDLVNPNAVSICSADFEFMMSPDVPIKDRYIGIVSIMLEIPAKGILSSNNFRAAVPLYDNKPHKLGGKQWLVTTDGRESRMFIIYGFAYLPVRCPTD